jgi:hypothetical protein
MPRYNHHRGHSTLATNPSPLRCRLVPANERLSFAEAAGQPGAATKPRMPGAVTNQVYTKLSIGVRLEDRWAQGEMLVRESLPLREPAKRFGRWLKVAAGPTTVWRRPGCAHGLLPPQGPDTRGLIIRRAYAAQRVSGAYSDVGPLEYVPGEWWQTTAKLFAPMR